MGHDRSRRSQPCLSGFQALVVMALGVATMTLAMTVSRGLGIRLALTLSEVLLMTPGLLALGLRGIPLQTGVGLLPIATPTALLSLASGAALWVASLGLMEVQYALWSPPAEYLEGFRRLHQALRPSSPADAMASLLAVAIVPALCEEILVRGIVLRSFLVGWGPSGSIVASAFLFGLMHLDPYRLPFTFAVGLALGVIRLRAGSVLPPILAHAALNALTFAVAPYLDDPGAPMPAPQPLLGLTLLAAGTVVTAAMTRWLRR